MRLPAPTCLAILVALALLPAPAPAQGVMDQLKEIEKQLEARPEPKDPLDEARQRCALSASPCRSQLVAQGYAVTHRGPVYRSQEGEHWLILMRRGDELALCVMVREGRRNEPVELPCVPMKPDATGG